jgi:phage-related minor tail protein
LAPAEIVSSLRETLGAALVAYLGGVRETRAVREWAEGVRSPSGEAVQRLRTSYYVMAMLRDRESPATVASWFQGMNPELEDVAPARVLREQDLDTAGPAVLSAARSFIAHG